MTDPIVAAFETAFSTPSAADTCAPTFQGLSTRVSSEFLACDVDALCCDLEASCIVSNNLIRCNAIKPYLTP